jgi:hypothetical protein
MYPKEGHQGQDREAREAQSVVVLEQSSNDKRQSKPDEKTEESWPGPEVSKILKNLH